MRRLPTETIRFLTLDETARLFRAIGPSLEGQPLGHAPASRHPRLSRNGGW
jgi:hypothetical protein